MPSFKVPIILSILKKKTLIFHRSVKNTEISNFMISFQWEPIYSTLMEAQTEDGQVRQTDMTKLMVAFCNFVSMPKNLNTTASSWAKNQDNILNTMQDSQSLNSI
jgi:hypothetical protein